MIYAPSSTTSLTMPLHVHFRGSLPANEVCENASGNRDWVRLGQTPKSFFSNNERSLSKYCHIISRLFKSIPFQKCLTLRTNSDQPTD